MALLKSYLKQRRKGLFIFVLFCAIFFLTFSLYHLPFRAILYPVLLCTLFGSMISAYDFLKMAQKHRKLLELKKQGAALILSLPKAETLLESDYQELIRELQKELADLETGTNARYRDMMEYYTVWVHQIKTPIASMQLSLQSEDTPLSRKLSADLFRIEQYVEMVLAFLRLNSVSTDYVFKEHRLDTIVSQAVAKFASEFIERKINLQYSPKEMAAQTVVTDEKWLSFVIEQILSNALKYTRSGSIRLYLKDEKTLCIEDTGIGIAPEDLPRIFEKGYTGYNGRIDKKASGLGLYLCKRICRNLGAEISADSVPGQGTTMYIRLQQYDLNLTKM